MSHSTNIKGPYIVWVNYGYEGWQPRSFNTLVEALTTNHGADFEITKKITLTLAEDGKVIVE